MARTPSYKHSFPAVRLSWEESPLSAPSRASRALLWPTWSHVSVSAQPAVELHPGRCGQGPGTSTTTQPEPDQPRVSGASAGAAGRAGRQGNLKPRGPPGTWLGSCQRPSAHSLLCPKASGHVSVLTCFVVFQTALLIRNPPTTKIYPDKAYNSLASSIFTELCDHPHNCRPFPLNKPPHSSAVTPHCPRAPAPGNHTSAFCLYGVTCTGHFTYVGLNSV